MKLLTLNTHGLQEADYEEKLDAFVQFVLKERPDIIALQEVSQRIGAEPEAGGPGYFALEESRIALRRDNHALRIADCIRQAGCACSWTWLPVKLGYENYDEGAALMCLNAGIAEADVFTISRTNDYRNWRTRRALGVRPEGCEEWFYSVHMGWWGDAEEPFREQWDRLNAGLKEKTARSRVWLLGDFNVPAQLRNQGYDRIVQSGWQDAYCLAETRDDGITVRGTIDGWHGAAQAGEGMRIDYIWCSEYASVNEVRVAFDGKYEPVVSDHFGVFAEVWEKEQT